MLKKRSVFYTVLQDLSDLRAVLFSFTQEKAGWRVFNCCRLLIVLKTRAEVRLSNGETLSNEKEDYHGFFTRPFTRDDAVAKFERFTAPEISRDLQQKLIGLIEWLEGLDDVTVLTCMIADIR